MNQNPSQSQKSRYSNNYQKKDFSYKNENPSKYSSSNPYQASHDYRNNNFRERSRSREMNRRHSFNDHQNYNINQKNQNNYENNQRYKPNYYRQQMSDHNNQRQYESKYSKDKFNNLQNPEDMNNKNIQNTNNFSKNDCLIVLPKNYYNYITQDFDKLKNRLRNELKDNISNIIYNFTVPGFNENIFKFTVYELSNRTTAIRIIAEFLFDAVKKVYEKTTYLKLSFLIPDNVIGFIIGIEGKNINQIREETNAKIEVYSPNNSVNYRKIEIAGDPRGIAGAAEKIYEITKKYFYFNMEKILNRNERDDRRDFDYERDNRDRDFNNYKDRNNSGYKNKDYHNMGYKDRDYKGMYNKERNEYRDMGYKNDYKNRDGGYRNYGNNRDNNRDMNKNY